MFKKAGDYVGFGVDFHDPATGALADPTSPTAELRIVPKDGSAEAFTALPTPTKLNGKTGYFGGSYQVPATPTPGDYFIRMTGTFSGTEQGAIVRKFTVGVSDGKGPDEVLALLQAEATGKQVKGAGGAYAFRDPTDTEDRIAGTVTAGGRTITSVTPPAS
jgi:hypothetical protein